MFNAEMISAPASQASGILKPNLSNMLDTLEAHELRICVASERYHRLLNSLRFRLQIVTRIHADAKADSQRLITEIQAAQAPVDRLLVRFTAEYKKLQQVWNLRYPTERRNHQPFGQMAGP
jgi:hypothetical protein